MPPLELCSCRTRLLDVSSVQPVYVQLGGSVGVVGVVDKREYNDIVQEPLLGQPRTLPQERLFEATHPQLEPPSPRHGRLHLDESVDWPNPFERALPQKHS